MVLRGEIFELWRCSREITALAQTAGCPTATPHYWTVVARAVVSRGQQSRENIVGRVGTLSPRQTFNDLSTRLLCCTIQMCKAARASVGLPTLILGLYKAFFIVPITVQHLKL